MKEQTLSHRLHIDIPLLFGLGLLCLVGLVVLYSAGNQDIMVVVRQAIRMMIAAVVMILVAQLPPGQLARWSPWLYLIGLGLLVLVLSVGHIGKGAQRWLDLGFFRFQPSELMKLAVPMMVAWYLSSHPCRPP